MQRRSVVGVLVLLSLAAVVHAHGDRDRVRQRYETTAADAKFDPRDLSGIWTLTRNDHTLGTPPPPLTMPSRNRRSRRGNLSETV